MAAGEPPIARFASKLIGERKRRPLHASVAHRTDKWRTVADTRPTASDHGGRAAAIASDALQATVRVFRLHATPRISK